MAIDEQSMTPEMKRIWDKLRQLVTYDKNMTVFGARSHKYRIYPCLTEIEILDFERQYQVSIPEDYRHFLLEIADGGAGPDYGLYRLQDPKRQINSLLSHSWPHRAEWDLKSSQFASIQEFNLEYERDEHTQGALSICDMGCGYEVLLVLTGEERGTIWHDLRAGDKGIIPVQNVQSGALRVSFSEWYEMWLDNSLAT